ncbi:MAG: phosphopantetheine-binding protein [Draconibacterium sp.]|nr:phosphopantetheine-binding protein [Draconibacterium sp.]
METEALEEKSIRRRLYRVLRKTGVNKENIQPDASFIDDLNFDNIDWTIFTNFLERDFNISIKDEELSKFGKVDDTLHYLKMELTFLSN